MRTMPVKFFAIWCIFMLSIALARVHFRVVTTGVAYELGKLKTKENLLLEHRSQLQSELARISGRKQLESLADDANPMNPSPSRVQ
jgi:hypothetical protein